MHFPTTPTEWMYLVLILPKIVFGMASLFHSNVGLIDSKKIPPNSKALGNDPEVLLAIT